MDPMSEELISVDINKEMKASTPNIRTLSFGENSDFLKMYSSLSAKSGLNWMMGFKQWMNPMAINGDKLVISSRCSSNRW